MLESFHGFFGSSLPLLLLEPPAEASPKNMEVTTGSLSV